jgi:hypothetical protein
MQIIQITFPIADTAEISDISADSVMTLSARDADNEHLFDDEKTEFFCTDINDDDYRFFETLKDALEHVSYYVVEANTAVQRAI